MLNMISVAAGLLLAWCTPPAGYEQGVILRIYTEGAITDRWTDPDPAQDLQAVLLATNVDFLDQDDFGGFEDHFRADVRGELLIEQPGRYEFALISDDGSDLTIDGQTVVRNDGLHGVRKANGSIDLDAGLHPFRVRYFEHGGDEVLQLRWRPPGQRDLTRVPDRVLMVRADESGSRAAGIGSMVAPAAPDRPGLSANPRMFLPPEVAGGSSPKASLITQGAFQSQLLWVGSAPGQARRVQLEEVNGVVQGAAYPADGSAESPKDGAAEIPFGPIDLGLAEPRPSSDAGRQTLEIQSTRAIPGGFEIRFSEPIEPEALESEASYRVEQWYYVPAQGRMTERQELQQLRVDRAIAGEDGTSVQLMIPGLRPGRVVHLWAELPVAGERSGRRCELWYTLHTMPGSPERPAPDLRVLVFTRTAGFRHASIPEGIAAIRALGERFGFDVHATEDPAWFNTRALWAYDAVVFLSTTGDVLDDRQQAAFERYIRSGGGYVGVHAASDTEYDWPWYGRLVGAYFQSHPAIQDATIHVLDQTHIATSMLPAAWVRRDEWYNFRAGPTEVDILARLDETTYTGGTMNNDHPIIWCHVFDGGRAFYTAGGHTSESFHEPLFLQHLAGGIFWAAGRTGMPE